MKTWKFVIAATVLFAVCTIGIRKLFFDEFNTQIVVEAVVGAIVFSAIFFFVGMKLLKRTSKNLLKSIPDVELNSDEKLLLESGASHYKGIEAVGGKLVLTNKRLIFVSHKLNLQNHKEEFAINEIKSVDKDSKFNIFNLKVANDQIHRFLVDSPADWIKAISH